MTRKRSQEADKETPLDTSEFDQEFIADTFRPLTADEKKHWARVRAKKSASNGKRKTQVAIEVDPDLLDRVDVLAKRLGVSRDSVIARGLKAVLAATGDM